MNPVDIALLALLGVCAIRGFWRGFFRECFGFFGLVAGIAAALRFADEGAAVVAGYIELPRATGSAVAFIGIFMLVHTLTSLVGLLLDQLASTATLRGVSRLAGAAFGVGKGGAVLAFVLLFLHLFPVVPVLDQQIRESRIAPPLVSLAGNVIRAGLRDSRAPGESGRA